MSFVTQDKLVIIGAAGMIGSNMAQTAAMMRLTPVSYTPLTSQRLYEELSISYLLVAHLAKRA